MDKKKIIKIVLVLILLLFLAFIILTIRKTIILSDIDNSLLERIINSILTSIKTVKIDGKEFYEVSGKYSPSTLYSENTEKISVYVEKETGLTIKKVEIINENGQKVENITTFEYKFDSVTDEDVKEPN